MSQVRYVKLYNIEGRDDYILEVKLEKDGTINIDFHKVPQDITKIIINGGEAFKERLYGVNFIPVNSHELLNIDCSIKPVADYDSSSSEEEDFDEVEQCFVSMQIKQS